MSEDPQAPYPEIDDKNRFFWTSGEDGLLRFLRCQACRTYIHPPAPRCRACMCEEVAPEPVSGKAVVEAYTINYQPWHPAFPPPYALAIVALEEAPEVRLTTQLVGCALDDVKIGAAVQVTFRRAGPAWLPMFQPRPA